MVGFVVGVVFLPIIIYVLNVIGRLSVRLFNNGRTTENPQSP
jgi:Na+-transporting methylmalonyl-CoA/oxaloacetate decarboxylase gamma subunit